MIGVVRVHGIVPWRACLMIAFSLQRRVLSESGVRSRQIGQTIAGFAGRLRACELISLVESSCEPSDDASRHYGRGLRYVTALLRCVTVLVPVQYST